MYIAILKDDNRVNVDGESHTVDLSALPADFHALQWSGTKGEVEYRMVNCEHCGGRNKKGNEFITDLTPYQKYVDAWNVAKTAANKAAEEAKFLAEIGKAARATG
jgi:hypothetical protein